MRCSNRCIHNISTVVEGATQAHSLTSLDDSLLKDYPRIARVMASLQL